MTIRNIIIAGIAALLMLFAGVSYFIYPSLVMRHKTVQALEELNAAVAARERTKINAALKQMLAERAHIKLNVRFLFASRPNSPPVAQEFDKEHFLAFVDNILYSLEDYRFDARLQDFHPDKARKAEISFHASGRAKDSAYLSNMRYDIGADCAGQADFNTSQAVWDDMECTVLLGPQGRAGK